MSLFREEIVIDGEISAEEALRKWDNVTPKPIKGSAMFFHSRSKRGNDKLILKYYSSYGRDFCDAEFSGHIEPFDDGKCMVTGKVTASRSMKVFATVFAAVAFPLSWVLAILLYYVDRFARLFMSELPQILPSLDDDTGLWFLVGLITLTLAIIAMMCLIIDRNKVNAIMQYLHKFTIHTEDRQSTSQISKGGDNADN